jgi:hypothetical protein
METLFGNRAFVDIVKFGWGYNEFRVSDKSNDWFLFKERRGKVEHRDIEGRKPCEDGNRNWSKKDIRQGMTRIAHNHPKVGRGKEWFFPRALRGRMGLLTS